MSFPLPANGRCRAVIDKVLPAVDCGAFAVRRVIGDSIVVTAHVIADGHDHLAVFLRHRKCGARDWVTTRMRELGNDEFNATLKPEHIGLYEYDVVALVDAFASWRAGFARKADDGQDLSVELVIGAQLVAAAAARAQGEDAAKLQAWSGFLADAARDFSQRVQLARGHELAAVMSAWPDWSLATEMPQPFLLSLERRVAAFGAWYEFFPRSCANDGVRHGTFRDAMQRLPEIARMGFDIIYLPPIHPIGRVFRKGRNNALVAGEHDVGSPWAIGSEEGGHKAIHPQLGTMDDFKAFIEEAARHGLEVALDIAFQCAPDHPYVKEHPQWFKWRPDGTVQYAENPPKKYQDILPFDFECEDWKALWTELKSVFEFWIAAGVKIFRVDNPHTKPMEFWRWCFRDIKERHPEVITLSEAFTRPKRRYRLAKANFTQGYTYFTWRNSPAALREYLTELTQSEVRDYFWPNFWPNTPDILHADLQDGNRATFIGRYVLAATLSSNVGIYGPAYETLDREPYPGKEEYNNNEKYQLKAWHWDCPGNIKDEIARVNRIRRENAALQSTWNLRFLETENPYVLAYLKQSADGSNRILVIVNMDWHWTQSGFVHLPTATIGLGPDSEYAVEDLFDPARPIYRWRGARNFFKLDPLKSPAHILRVHA